MIKTTKRVSMCSVITLLLFIVVCSGISWGKDTPVKIGVLAERGIAQCIEKWSPTAEYLTDRIPGKTFVIVPVDFDGIFSFVELGIIDFVLTNPSMYVELETWYGVNRIATLKNKRIGRVVTKFGGLIFCKADRDDIQTLNDLKNKTFMAATQTSFGGWRMALREFQEKGVDPYSDFKEVRFGGTNDTVVYAMRDGKVDAGTVRTDTLERMAMDGNIDINTFRIINDLSGQYKDFPFAVSTQLYPEWPFARVKHTTDELAERVAIALLEMPANSPAAIAAKCAGWTIPLNYQPVHECLKELRLGPYKDFGKITPAAVVKKYWAFILTIVILFAAVLGAAIFILRLNRNIKIAHVELQSEVEGRKQIEESLRESEKKYRTILESIEDGYYEVDIGGKFTFFNDSLSKIFGLTEDELMGKNFRDFTDQETNKKGYQVFNKVYTTGKPAEGFGWEIIRKEGLPKNLWVI